MKIKPISVTADGCAHTITVSLPDHTGVANINLGKTAHFPVTVVLVVYEE